MTIRLTQTVQKGGCAAKISAEVLRETLGKLDFTSADPAVLIDGKNFDDAGIYQVTAEIALVQTLDFFTPIVDTARRFGSIAAANALSDVYAMGGDPKTCMAILAFPLAVLDSQLMQEVMAGALAKVKESGASLIGGHSIDDDTLKFGLSVTGVVHPEKIWSNAKAAPGDHLILTKALGTGTLTAGLKASAYREEELSECLDSMEQLNQIKDLLSDEECSSIHSATDVTGFGLAGHAVQMAKASAVSFQIEFRKLPLFDLALSSLRAENLTRAHVSNQKYTHTDLKVEGEILAADLKILFDPQTSGGLLLSVDPQFSAQLVEKLRARFKKAEVIGLVAAQTTLSVKIHG